MIQAKDLRAGSIYLFSGNSEGLFDYEDVPGILQLNDEYGFYVYFNGMSNEMLSSFRSEQIKPIPLTPEILTKAGFEKSDSNYMYLYKFGKEFGIYIKPTMSSFSYQTCVWNGERLQFLHQLQNLYHALTGEELTVNL